MRSLKQIIRDKKILQSGAFKYELVIPGEPMIYSIKYDIGHRRHSAQFWRNRTWISLFKVFFRAYMNPKTPVVILVRFYVGPPKTTKLNADLLKKEKIPAVNAFETCDYLLSFLDLFRMVLIKNFRQIVKIDAEKYYSNNPRTVFKFLHWDHYKFYRDNNTLYSETKSLCPGNELF